jgi:hypothetical protein
MKKSFFYSQMHRARNDIATIFCQHGLLEKGRQYEESKKYIIALPSGSSSVAERQLPKLNVAGSIPVSRSN